LRYLSFGLLIADHYESTTEDRAQGQLPVTGDLLLPTDQAAVSFNPSPGAYPDLV